MKLLHILLGVLFCLASVSGRNLHESNINDEYSADGPEKPLIDPTAKQLRHRRRTPFYDYNYHDRSDYNYHDRSDYNYHDRSDYNRQRDENYSQILGYLEKIAHNLRSTQPPPPPPQPIYIPYPVLRYVPQYINCNNKAITNNSAIPNFNNRAWFRPNNEDDRLIFGVVPGIVDTDNSDGSYPIDLDPIPPSINVNESPKVDHGTTQTGPERPKTEPTKPGVCKAAILSCCYLGDAELRACFMKYDCPRTYASGLACQPEVIKRVLEEFVKAYAPVDPL